MNTVRFVPRWRLNKKSLRPMPKKHDWSLGESAPKLLRSGLLLAIIGASILALSGCQPTVIRGDCAPYPLPPKDLMSPPWNKDLVPSSMLLNAKPASTAPSSTPRN